MDNKENERPEAQLPVEPNLTEAEKREGEIADILWEESEAEGGFIEIPEDGDWGS